MAQPNPTLYLQNLGEDCKQSDVKRLLFGLFSAHGKVLDVVVSPKMKGQAFVVFADLQASTAARRREDGQAFLGKRMRIHYAKSNSHATILHNEGSEALYHTKLGVAEKKHGKLIVSSAQKDQMDAHAAASGKNKRGGGDSDDDEDEEMDSEQPKQKKLKVSADDDDEAAMEEESDDEDDVGPAPANGGAPKEVPHNILAVDNLPSEVTSDMLTVLFQQFPGYTSMRYHSVNGTANVTYDTWQTASEAKKALDGFQIAPEVLIGVNFAEKNA